MSGTGGNFSFSDQEQELIETLHEAPVPPLDRWRRPVTGTAARPRWAVRFALGSGLSAAAALGGAVLASAATVAVILVVSSAPHAAKPAGPSPAPPSAAATVAPTSHSTSPPATSNAPAPTPAASSTPAPSPPHTPVPSAHPSASAAPTPPPTPPPSGAGRWDFEDGGVDGWLIPTGWCCGLTDGPATTSSGGQAYWGTHALAVTIAGGTPGVTPDPSTHCQPPQPPGVGAYECSPAVATYTNVSGVAGATVTFRIYAPSAGDMTVRAYWEEYGTWTDHLATGVTLQSGWNSVSMAVPAGAAVHGVGMEFDDQNYWSGTLYLDHITVQ